MAVSRIIEFKQDRQEASGGNIKQDTVGRTAFPPSNGRSSVRLLKKKKNPVYFLMWAPNQGDNFWHQGNVQTHHGRIFFCRHHYSGVIKAPH